MHSGLMARGAAGTVGGTIAFLRNVDEPEMAWLIWAGSSISFLSAKHSARLIRGRKWILLPIAIVFSGFGVTIVLVTTWACLFFE